MAIQFSGQDKSKRSGDKKPQVSEGVPHLHKENSKNSVKKFNANVENHGIENIKATQRRGRR